MSNETNLWRLVGVAYGRDFNKVGGPCYVGITVQMNETQEGNISIQPCYMLFPQDYAVTTQQAEAIATFYAEKSVLELPFYKWNEQLGSLRDSLEEMHNAK